MREGLENIGEKLKDLRTKKGISITEMAHKTGLCRNTISGIESGKHGTTVGTYMKIAKHLGQDAWKL